MKFDTVGRLEEVVWNMRLADLPRGGNRAILQSLYNGEPPFDEDKAEENSIQVNRNFLEGTNLLAQGRKQWNRAFMGPGNYFNVTLDSGPRHRRREWGSIITRNWNRRLKKSPAMMEQIRSTGANAMLYGIGPVTWTDRRTPYPRAMAVSSLMVPSETDVDLQNLEYFAVFREWTPAQLYALTHGKRVDPGWNMEAVSAQLEYVAEQTQKQPNATAYQYMPERIQELIKQDMGFWGSDAVPTIDVWDCFFREADDGGGWYRRVFLDWEVSDNHREQRAPDSKNNSTAAGYGGFLYTSKKRKYASRLSEIIHCQFADCSAYAPFKYHSVRSLGWLLWGVCDLQNRARCKFSEAVFEQLMWIFRVSGKGDFDRIKKAIFQHMGVIPPGVQFVPANERFKPDLPLVNAFFNSNRQIMSENASSFTQSPENSDKEMTAAETMARVQAVNQLVSGMMGLAYEYERFKGTEIARRFCLPFSKHPDVAAFRLDCLTDGVPRELLDSDRWDIQPERVIGGGNKTLELAQAGQLVNLRKFLPPAAQRRVDHIAVEAYTDDPALADQLAPLDNVKPPTVSAHDAQLATDRILRGLEFKATDEMVPEDYVQVWLKDLATLLARFTSNGNMVDADKLFGLVNLSQHLKEFLALMAKNDEAKDKVKQYADALKKLDNAIKGMAQRLKEQMAAQQNGNGGLDPETKAKLAGTMLIQKQKAKNMEQSHAMRTAQHQAQFELEQQRKDRETQAEIRREDARTAQELSHNRLNHFFE